MAGPAAPLVEKTAEPDRAASAEPEIGRPQANRQTLKTLRQKEMLVGDGWSAAVGIER